MKQAVLWIAVSIFSYLLGSLNFSIIISKRALHDDIRNHGSGNAGLTNSYRTMGGKLSALVLLGDFAKGFAAAAVGGLLFGPVGKLIAGAFALIGHIFPIYFRFRGGKGVLTGVAMILAFDYRIFFIAIAIFLISVFFTKFISLGSILAAASFPICVWFFHYDLNLILISSVLALMVIISHRTNIARLLNGTERKFSFNKKREADLKK